MKEITGATIKKLKEMHEKMQREEISKGDFVIYKNDLIKGTMTDKELQSFIKNKDSFKALTVMLYESNKTIEDLDADKIKKFYALTNEDLEIFKKFSIKNKEERINEKY